MRDIKYKMWKDNKMYQWEEIRQLPMASFNEMYMTNPPKPVGIFLQFTGLKDKNGKEIFEGDIIQHCEIILEVKPIIPIDRFYEGYPGDNDDWMSMSNVDWNIVGNIYENQNLLTLKNHD